MEVLPWIYTLSPEFINFTASAADIILIVSLFYIVVREFTGFSGQRVHFRDFVREFMGFTGRDAYFILSSGNSRVFPDEGLLFIVPSGIYAVFPDGRYQRWSAAKAASRSAKRSN